MSNLKGCFSHETDNWKTPSNLYNFFMKAGFIDCFQYESKENELLNNYENKKLYVNPPYSKMKDVTKWIIKQAEKNTIWLLVPARTDTQWFHDLLTLKPTLYFIKGRLHFNDSKTVAPFPSVIMVFDFLKARIYNGIKIENLEI